MQEHTENGTVAAHAAGAPGYPETADIETSSDDYATRFRGASGAWMLSVQEKAVLRLLRGVVPQGARILDVGGGHGQLARPLARAGYRVCVLSSSEECRRRIADLVEAGAVEFKVGNVIDMPFGDREFDAVVAVRMLTHCSAWKTLVREMCRTSAGPVVTDYPTSQSLNAIAPALFKAKKKFEKNTRTWTLFRHAEVNAAFGDCGFRATGRVGQFFLPMVVHRMLKAKFLSAALEGACRVAGLSRLFGTPVVGRWERRTAGDKPVCPAARVAVFAAAAALAAAGCATGGGREAPALPILSEGQKAWFAKSAEERRVAFTNEEMRITLKALGDKPLGAVIAADFSPMRPEAAASATIENLEAGRSYEFPVSATTPGNAATSIGVLRLRTEDTAPRLLDVPGVPNFRDLGAWRGLGGRRVKQGLLFRSAAMNENASPSDNPTLPGASRLTEKSRLVLLEALGVKTDIDLRLDSEVFGMASSPLGPGVAWLHVPFGMYQWIEGDEAKAAFARIFRALLAPGALPAVVHCTDGQDRTGTLCFLLGGLLGVERDDLVRDWEATALHNPSTGFRHEIRIDKLLSSLAALPGGTMREKIESYAAGCGIRDAEIAEWRAIMLEP
ncbi:MAG: tyrosine-protein phosphatase [Kiritimatiellae bacterium]|nr:tyrosine-protein phosphatase [Kiritimatiellia bacterium]